MIKKIHKSVRGKTIDFDNLQKMNPNVIAAGNARYNARGDQLAAGGKIEKTAEQIRQEKSYVPVEDTPATKHVSIKNNIDDLRKARTNWSTMPYQDADPEDAISIAEAVDMINPNKKEKDDSIDESSNSAKTTSKSTSKNKRTITEE